MKKEVPVAAKHATRELMDEGSADWEEHGKKQKLKEIMEGVTDPECGLFIEGEYNGRLPVKPIPPVIATVLFWRR